MDFSVSESTIEFFSLCQFSARGLQIMLVQHSEMPLHFLDGLRGVASAHVLEKSPARLDNVDAHYRADLADEIHQNAHHGFHHHDENGITRKFSQQNVKLHIQFRFSMEISRNRLILR